MLFDIANETLPREQLRALQLTRLQYQCERVYANVPFYKRAFDEAGMKPADVKSLRDLSNLPFTEKQDLRDHYPFGMFAVPRANIARVHASSGTTGKATVVGYTRRDIDTWAQLMARAFATAGAKPGDVIHNAYGYGLFTGGLGAHYGGEALGATMVPVSGGGTRRQVTLLKDFAPDIICCTPSYALHLYEAARDQGIDIRELPLHTGIFGAEPWTEEMRRDIEKKLGITAIDIYGLSEIMGPGVGIECHEAQAGLHLQEDHFLFEIIDPDTGETLPEGDGASDRIGELVVTTLTKEGIPLIRYRTRDITSIDYTPCVCGRTTARMQRVTGRSDDMLIIRGVNVFPSQIESILLETKGVAPHYLLVVDRKGNMDTLEVQVEVDEANFSDEIKRLQKIEMEISKTIKDFLGVSARVKLVEPKTIERSVGKAKRIQDNRN